MLTFQSRFWSWLNWVSSVSQLNIYTGFKLPMSAWPVSVYLQTRVKIYKSVVEPLKCVIMWNWTDLLKQSNSVCGPDWCFFRDILWTTPSVPPICLPTLQIFAGGTRPENAIRNWNMYFSRYFCPNVQIGKWKKKSSIY